MIALRMTRHAFFAVAVLLASVVTAAAQSLPAPSYWRNQLGSELTIWSVAGGEIRGEFINRAQGYQCRDTPYPVVGRETPRGVFFVVSFAQCNSITRWIGRVRGTTMPTKWELHYIRVDGGFGILRGADTFVRAR